MESAYRAAGLVRFGGSGGVDIHKPKPWHGVREFLKEYLIIVIGVLTALGAEQVVQAVDWSRRVGDTERDLRAELQSNAVNAFGRLVSARCATVQIQARRLALRDSGEHNSPVPLMAPYRRGQQAWPTDSWESARTSQLTGHIETDRLRRYSLAYTLAAAFREQQRAEQDLKPGVDTLSDNAGQLTPQERDRIFLALRQLEEQSNRLDLLAFRYLEAVGRLGISVPKQDRVRMVKSGSDYYGKSALGDCVQDPSPWLGDGEKAVSWVSTRQGAP